MDRNQRDPSTLQENARNRQESAKQETAEMTVAAEVDGDSRVDVEVDSRC